MEIINNNLKKKTEFKTPKSHCTRHATFTAAGISISAVFYVCIYSLLPPFYLC